MLFKNIKSVDLYYKYPMSYRIGAIYDKFGIIRIYSNGKKEDYETSKYFYYFLKNEKIKEQFKNNIKNKKKVRVVIKVKNIVEDRGLMKVNGFFKNFVKLEK
mgnify:CR=1 FL=1|tara:strand:+ start:1158 stop:1463 length:306 start_codon:yes stop_codon:yes gene_type:complete